MEIILFKLLEAGDYSIILGGDFNIVLDSVVDQSRCNYSKPLNSLLTLKGTGKFLGLMDIWRTMQPNERDYTFCSCAHQVYSRIDVFLISKSLFLWLCPAQLGIF